MIHFSPPPVQTTEPARALATLWAFVDGLGFDPALVVSAYDAQEAFTLGSSVGSLHASLVASIQSDAASVFGFTDRRVARP